MNKIIPILFLILICSCQKTDKSDFIWEKTYGSGEALFMKATGDSGIIASGAIGGNPYLLRLDKRMSKVVDFSSSGPGVFSSVWFDTTSYITAGSSQGKMLLIRLDMEGKIVWDTTLNAVFNINNTSLWYTDNGTFLAVGTAGAEASADGPAGLLMVRFDTTGEILTKEEITGTGFLAAQNGSLDNSGNIYLALTKVDGGRSKASVAKFNSNMQKLWETDLYNNPDFGSASLDIQLDGSENVYVSGKTELSQEDGVSNSSFVVSLTNDGSIRWKKYLESSNAGSSLIMNAEDHLIVLNRNCFILNILNPSDGSDAGRVKVLDVCDSKDSDAHGMDLDQNSDGNILLAGSKGGSFYIALKSFEY